MSKLKMVTEDKLYTRPTYKVLQGKDVLSINPGKDVYKFDKEKMKKHFKDLK